MSSFDLLRERLGHALDCARRIAESSRGLIFSLQEPQDAIRRLRRDLPHLNNQVLAVFNGDPLLTADLRHELESVAQDSFRMADWAASTQYELRVLFDTDLANPSAPPRYGKANHDAFQECERYRQAVFESCHQTFLVANRVCAATDKATSASPPFPLPNLADDREPPSSGNDLAAPSERTEAPKDAVGVAGCRDALLQQLKPAVRLAYRAYEYAEAKSENRLEDRAAYDLLEEEGIPEDSKDWGDLEGYELPAFATWTRYLRDARSLLGESKHSPRRARSSGKSIARGD
jgi:hypothetical protein